MDSDSEIDSEYCEAILEELNRKYELERLKIQMSHVKDFSQQFASTVTISGLSSEEKFSEYRLPQDPKESTEMYENKIQALKFHNKLTADASKDKSIGLAVPKKGILKRPSTSERGFSPSSKRRRVHFATNLALTTVKQISSQSESTFDSSLSSSTSSLTACTVNKQSPSEISMYNYRVRSIISRKNADFHKGLGFLRKYKRRLTPKQNNEFIIDVETNNHESVLRGKELMNTVGDEIYKNKAFDEYFSEEGEDGILPGYMEFTKIKSVQTLNNSNLDDTPSG